jgi:hypothetical protein
MKTIRWVPLFSGLGWLFLAGPAPAQGFDVAGLYLDKFYELSLPVPTPARVVVCHGFGCRSRTEVGLGAGDRARLTGILAQGRASPAAERKAVAQAIAWFGRRVGPEAGTTKAIGRPNARYIGGDPGQLDCVDTTANTMTLFYVLETLHLFRHHSLALPVSRHVFVDGIPHSTAVLRDIASGERWAFDPWPHNSGELPDVMPLQSWVLRD